MLALKDYGSSDDNSEAESDNENAKSEVNCNIDANDVSILESFPAEKLTTSVNMQICSAPEVVPTVNKR